MGAPERPDLHGARWGMGRVTRRAAARGLGCGGDRGCAGLAVAGECGLVEFRYVSITSGVAGRIRKPLPRLPGRWGRLELEPTEH